MSYTALYPRYCCSSPRCPTSKACCPEKKNDCDKDCKSDQGGHGGHDSHCGHSGHDSHGRYEHDSHKTPEWCRERKTTICGKTPGSCCLQPNLRRKCGCPCEVECGCGFYGLIPASEDPQFDCLKACHNVVRTYSPGCCLSNDRSGCSSFLSKCKYPCSEQSSGRVYDPCSESKRDRPRPPIPHLDEKPLKISNCTSRDLKIAVSCSKPCPKRDRILCIPKGSTILIYVSAPGCGACQYVWVFAEEKCSKEKDMLCLCSPYLIERETNHISINPSGEKCVNISSFHITCGLWR